MRRIAALIVIAAIVVAGGLAALPFLVSPEAVRESVIDQAALLTGKEISFSDTPQITFSPFLGIAISNVVIKDPEGSPDEPALLQMERLEGRLDIGAALLGEVRVRSYRLLRPRFFLSRQENGTGSWEIERGEIGQVLVQAREARAGQEATATPDLSNVNDLRFGLFEVVDGTVEYEDHKTGRKEFFTGINAEISWPNSSARLVSNGALIWRGEAFRYNLRTPSPLLLIAGGQAPLEYRLQSNALDLNFKGSANTLSDLYLAGQINATSPSLRRLAGLFGKSVQPGATFAKLSLQGSLQGTMSQLQLNDAAVSIDGNQGSGALRLSTGTDQKPLISGTLAFSSLDLYPYLLSLRQEISLGGQRIPGAELLELINADLRLSAGTASVNNVQMSEFALALSILGSEASFDIGNARLFDGTLVARLDLRRLEDKASVTAKATLSNFNASAFSSALAENRFSIGGRGNGQVRIDAVGASGLELVNGLRGTTSFVFENGAINGVDLEILRNTAVDPNADTDSLELFGQSPFTSFAGEIGFSSNSAWIRSLELEGGTVAAAVGGRMAVDLSAIALRLSLGPMTNGAIDAETKQRRYDALVFVGGSAENPLVTRGPVLPEDLRPGSALPADSN